MSIQKWPPACGYQAATGYVTTAEYHGTVTSWDNGSLAAPLLIIAAVLICAGIAAAALIPAAPPQKNVYVYVPDSKPREYRLIAKFRVEPDSEVPAIDAGALTLNPGDTVAVEVKKSPCQASGWARVHRFFPAE